MTKQKTTTEIIRCSRIVSSEQSTITLQPFEVVVQNEAQKNLKQIFFCLLSHIFFKKNKKKVFWDTGNKWIFLQTEHGVGVAGGFWEEFTASAALSSMKERTSIYFFYFSSGHQQPAGLVVVATGNLAILRGPCNTFSGMSVASHPGTPSTHAHHRCQQENES